MNLHLIQNWNEEFGYLNDEEKYVNYLRKKKFIIYSFESDEIHEMDDYVQFDYNNVMFGKSYTFKDREFCNINYSFLNFQKKYKKYYKDKINFYKNPKTLMLRQMGFL
tara:strand:- start:465 stop:788 length:324 start_codon:yes stop_codon:yes gene_type:complete